MLAQLHLQWKLNYPRRHPSGVRSLNWFVSTLLVPQLVSPVVADGF